MKAGNGGVPSVSVIMPVWNAALYVEDTIKSILGQTYHDFEYIIVDDGSTDDTPTILRAFAALDSRIRLVTHASNRGISAAWNTGLDMALGHFIACTDADDISRALRLEKQVACLDVHPETVLVSTNWHWMNMHPDTYTYLPAHIDADPCLLQWHLLFYNQLSCHSAVMYRTDAIRQVGGYSENYTSAVDYDLWERMSALGTFTMLPDLLVWFRREVPGGVTVTHRASQCASAANVSVRAIQHVIGTSIDPSWHRIFSSFWPVYWKLPFPSAVIAPALHSLLRECAIAFCASWECMHPESTAPTQKLIAADVHAAFHAWLTDARLRGSMDDAAILQPIIAYWSAAAQGNAPLGASRVHQKIPAIPGA